MVLKNGKVRLPHFAHKSKTDCDDFSNDSLFETLKAYATEKGYKIGYVMWPIRTAVSGKQMTPGGATELMEVFGKEESIARIKNGIEKLSNN